MVCYSSIDAEVQDNDDGTYSVSFVGTSIGEHDILIYLERKQLSLSKQVTLLRGRFFLDHGSPLLTNSVLTHVVPKELAVLGPATLTILSHNSTQLVMNLCYGFLLVITTGIVFLLEVMIFKPNSMV